MSTVNYNNSYRVTGGLQRFDCLAWVNFNGTGTVAIRASGNVSSITDNGTGDYTVNFTSALPDGNCAPVGLAARASDGQGYVCVTAAPTTTSFRFQTRRNTDNGIDDALYVFLSFFR